MDPISDNQRFQGLLIRIELLEAEFRQLNPKDSFRQFLLQVELAEAYQTFNSLMPKVHKPEMQVHEN